MPWIVEDLYFHGLDELSDRQAGYRFDRISGERTDAWPADRFVIAAWAANPVSVGQDGSICYSRHGVDASGLAHDMAQIYVFFNERDGGIQTLMQVA